MTEIICRYSSGRDDVFVSYLYDDIDASERAAFEVHLAACARCRNELAALTGVRERLAQWSPPEPAFLHHVAQPAALPATAWWRDIPVWAQVAAALLVLGVAAGIANLDVRYGAGSLTVRTGWSKPPLAAAVAVPVATPLAAPVTNETSAAPWRAELATFEQRLRTEFRASPVSIHAAVQQGPSAPVTDAELMRRVRAIVDESERRQQRELALRVADVMRDVESERRADLVKIDRSLGLLQNNTGVEVMRNRQMLDYLVRVSQNK